MVEKHSVSVDRYKKKTPAEYRDHGDKVLAYVPKDSKWAKDPKTRARR